MKTLLLAVIFSVSLTAQNAAQKTGRPSSSPQAGEQLFSLNCSGCHGLDGRGGEHGPNIATRAEVQHLQNGDILRIVRDGIAGAGMPAFRSSLDEDQLNAVVNHLRILQGKNTSTQIQGNSERGRALFFGKARCSECHMIAGQGGFIASDLSGYGSQHSPENVRSAIIDPNKNLDPRHRATTAVMRDGRKYRGVALNEDNFSLQLQTLDGQFHLLDKATLTHIEREPRSIMPADYASKLSRADLDDLVSYLAASGIQRDATAREEDDP